MLKKHRKVDVICIAYLFYSVKQQFDKPNYLAYYPLIMSRLYVTTPIYYVNDQPHIGHAYTTLQADVAARAARQALGEDKVWFLTGTDEHGTKISQAAEKASTPVQEFVDKYAAIFQQTWKELNISNDDFIRTTEAQHVKAVQKIFTQLKQTKTSDHQDVVYEADYEGLYCEGCEKFLLPSELVDGKCPDHQTGPKQLKEKNWFFRLSAYLNDIEKLVNDDQIKIVPIRRKNEVLGLIKQLRELPNGGDFSISRESVKWGIDLPAEYGSGQKAYVWVDALTNYITALGWPDGENYKKFWLAEDSQVKHYLGQDILKFHAVYWPAILLALNAFPFAIDRPLELYIHGYFTINSQKMSKSLGNVIPPRQLIDRYSVDATRWLLVTAFPFGSESDTSLTQFDERYNAELANGIGNHVSRVTDMISRYLSGSINGDKAEDYLLSSKPFSESLSIMAHVSRASQLIQEVKPWEAIKTDFTKVAPTLRLVGENLINVSKALQPIMPVIAKKIESALNTKSITKLESLFPRLK